MADIAETKVRATLVPVERESPFLGDEVATRSLGARTFRAYLRAGV